MTSIALKLALLLAVASGVGAAPAALAQQAPTPGEISRYTGLHAAAAKGDLTAIRRIAARKPNLNVRDGHGRTPLMVAVHGDKPRAAAALIRAGADMNALDKQRYDALTIAGVAGNLAIVQLLLRHGAKPDQTTSPYEGTPLIATAHRGHVAIVKALIKAGAPLNHVNNLGWTALIEAIVLGDGGPRHTAIVAALVKARADLNIADRQGVRPLTLARRRGYKKIAVILEKAGAKP
jgi:ankyrin repeat protein